MPNLPHISLNIDINKGAQSVSAEFIDKLEDFTEETGLPQKLREVDIPKEAWKNGSRCNETD